MNVQEAPPRTQSDTFCPTCGAPAERGQLICLECGSRIALAYRKPPSWRLPAAIIVLVLLLAGAGAFFGMRALDDDADKEVAAQPAPVAKDEQKEKPAEDRPAEDKPAEDKPAEDKPADQKPADEKPAEEEQAQTPPATSGGIAAWPDGKDAFTVVILSSEDRASARAFAQNAVKSGVDAGMLKADDYPALSASQGFFIVFVGQYPNQAKADQAAARIGRNYQGAYPQFVDGSKAGG